MGLISMKSIEISHEVTDAKRLSQSLGLFPISLHNLHNGENTLPMGR